MALFFIDIKVLGNINIRISVSTSSPFKSLYLQITHKRLYPSYSQKRIKKWKKQKAEDYIKKCKEKGLTYLNAVDYLKHHKTMHSII